MGLSRAPCIHGVRCRRLGERELESRLMFGDLEEREALDENLGRDRGDEEGWFQQPRSLH